MSPKATTSAASTPRRAANRASPLAFDTPAAEISSSAVVEEWVSSTRSPTTSTAAARNASGSSTSCRASSLTAGPSKIVSSGAIARWLPASQCGT